MSKPLYYFARQSYINIPLTTTTTAGQGILRMFITKSIDKTNVWTYFRWQNTTSEVQPAGDVKNSTDVINLTYIYQYLDET